MQQKPKIAVILVAGGESSRMGGGVPKPYLLMHGKALICRAIEAFQAALPDATIQPVIRASHAELFAQAAGHLHTAKPVAGGGSRQASVFAGLKAIAAHAPDLVLIHDAARPFVSDALIHRVVDGLQKHTAVIPAIAVVDTVKEITGTKITRTLNRETLRAVQTPQGFHFTEILAAHQSCAGQALTDDAAVAEAASIEVYVVEGDVLNRKITTSQDLCGSLRAERDLSHAREFRTGSGFDVHRFVEVSPSDCLIKICGVDVKSHAALEGHSDADVGLHALVDAMLGAVAEGDIGQHFPPSDARWKGADSAVFVTHAKKLLQQKHAEIVNVDITLICELPKISPHRDVMRARIAELLELDISRVSVKATTTEKLGFTGRGEGIAAQAVVSIKL